MISWQQIDDALVTVQSEVASAELLRTELAASADPAALIRRYDADVQRFDAEAAHDPRAARESGDGGVIRAKRALLLCLRRYT